MYEGAGEAVGVAGAMLGAMAYESLTIAVISLLPNVTSLLNTLRLGREVRSMSRSDSTAPRRRLPTIQAAVAQAPTRADVVVMDDRAGVISSAGMTTRAGAVAVAVEVDEDAVAVVAAEATAAVVAVAVGSVAAEPEAVVDVVVAAEDLAIRTRTTPPHLRSTSLPFNGLPLKMKQRLCPTDRKSVV